MKQFLMGNQILAIAARDAGAKLMFGYPITPSSEILETWAKFCVEDENLDFMQTEDEMAAGFATIGACLAGVPAFTATAGPGNILMQDAFSMAEAQRIPTVAMIIQRGGLSTSTVIYSQQEVRLTCFGGNGEGFRIVYSSSNLQELYDYTLKSFEAAWKYRFPTFILADGYQGKMKGEVEISQEPKPKNDITFIPILKRGVNLRNCYNLEQEIGKITNDYAKEFENVREKIEEYETYCLDDAETAIVAHGIVASAAKQAIEILQGQGIKIGLFRPITLRPFPREGVNQHLKHLKRIITVESAINQLNELLKNELFGNNIEVIAINKPAVGFTPEEIAQTVKSL